MRDDDYELMPSSELEYLRKEVEKFKRNPLGDTQASITLLDSINKLNVSMTKLNAIFESANDDMVKAFNESAMREQLQKMAEQQEKLAKGIVAVAELVKDLQEQQKRSLPDMEQLISQSRAAQEAARPAAPQINPQAISADMQTQAVEAQVRNPFAEDHPGSNPDFKPLLNEPLPRPAQAYGAPIAQPQGPPPPLQAGAGRIPDSDIPPPPPRRY